jgi:hypothetical protein
MKITNSNIDQVFEFSGSLGMLSKCGIKKKTYQDKTVVLVTELYQDNPGTSITSVTASLAQQICAHFNILPQNLVYIECAPGMNSKLSFYDEVYYKVDFELKDGKLVEPKWSKLSKEKFRIFFEENV